MPIPSLVALPMENSSLLVDLSVSLDLNGLALTSTNLAILSPIRSPLLATLTSALPDKVLPPVNPPVQAPLELLQPPARLEILALPLPLLFVWMTTTLVS